MKRLWLLFLFIPTVALAAATHRPTGVWTDCANGSTIVRTSQGMRACYDQIDTASADSPPLEITLTSSICFDADIGDVVVVPVAGQTIYIRRIFGTEAIIGESGKVLADLDGGGITPSDDLPLNGDDGSTAQQRMCLYDVPAGVYYVRAAAAPPAGDKSRVMVRAQ